MEIMLKVMLDVTPRLELLAEKALTAFHTLGKGNGWQMDNAGSTEAAEEGQAPPAAPPQTQSQPEPATPQPEPAPESAIPDDETMRTLMDIAISRVCGTNDWKESSDPRVIDLRRSCTGCFREISRHFGADKPTGLQEESRNRFLRELDNIYVDEGQHKAVWQAF